MNEAGVYNDDDIACDYTLATLWVSGNDAMPDAVTEALELTPTGIKVIGPKTGGLRSRANVGQRSTEGVVVSRDSLRHVDHLLSLLVDKDAAVSKLISDG